MDNSGLPEGVVYRRVGCQPGERRGPGSRLPTSGWWKKGGPHAVMVQRPRSGSMKERPMRSEPEWEGSGREAVGSGRWAMMVGSSKENRGSGKWSSWLTMRKSLVRGVKTK